MRKRLEEVSTEISLTFMFRAVVLKSKKLRSAPKPRSRPRGSNRGSMYFNYEKLTRNVNHIRFFIDEKQTLPGKADGIFKFKVHHRRSDLQGKSNEEQRHANRDEISEGRGKLEENDGEMR